MKTKKTIDLFEGTQVWDDEKYASIDHPLDHWYCMPSFHPKDSTECYHSIELEFPNQQSKLDFFKKIDNEVTEKTRSIWYPKKGVDDYSTIRVISDDPELRTPKYPIYIPSKGRWETRLTSDTLIKMGISHFIVVEKTQVEQYRNATDPKWVTILVIPDHFFEDYETCDERGSTMSRGPGPARNFAWWHSIQNGFKRHWVMDDNMQNFYRIIGSKRIIVSDGAIIRAMEDHADQYENVAMSGPHYRFFIPPSRRLPPFYQNTRIYSCNLILNDIPFRWRGRWNEDTILSLDILKAGLCTIQYTAFLSGKIVTQAMGGGNTAEFYAKLGTKLKSEMLVQVHPDVSREVVRYGRDHHYVDYSPFKENKLVRTSQIPPTESNEYGMRVIYE